jgi:hypothetical protein
MKTKRIAVQFLLSLSLFYMQMRTLLNVKKNQLSEIKKVAVVSVYCPAAITIDNQRQAPVFYAVDATVQSGIRSQEAVKEFKPRGTMLLNKSQNVMIEKLSKNFGWQITPVSTSAKNTAYKSLVLWSDKNSKNFSPILMPLNDSALLWINKDEAELKKLTAEFCALTGSDAVLFLSFDFAYSKSWFKGSGISAKARTFIGMQLVDKRGDMIISTPRADERERDFSEMADTTMPLKGWTADINETTIKTFDSSTENSAAKVISMLKAAK